MEELIENGNNDTDRGKPRCAQCRRELDLGVDVIGIQQGVLGPRGFVHLDERKLLCGELCLEQYVCNGKPEVNELPRRIP